MREFCYCLLLGTKYSKNVDYINFINGEMYSSLFSRTIRKGRVIGVNSYLLNLQKNMVYMWRFSKTK